ncbi:hypothetical protein [Actinomadura macrotermitis]|nr:hypothetical protein [Actinomadura macrotermitis]
MAMAGAMSLGMIDMAEAAPAQPEPRGSVPAACRKTAPWDDWYLTRVCEEAWRTLHGAPARADRRHQGARRAPRARRGSHGEHGGKRTDPRRRPSPRPASPGPKASPSVVPPTTASPGQAAQSRDPMAGRAKAEGVSDQTRSLQALLLFGLLPAAILAAYPFRRRIFAVAGAASLSSTPPAEEKNGAAPFAHRPAFDPFVLPLLGLSGPGAAAAARAFALAALEECGDSALVVIARPDAMALFELTDDELLDEVDGGLFIPGNIDAALASVETELAARHRTGGARTCRILLIAACPSEPVQPSGPAGEPGRTIPSRDASAAGDEAATADAPASGRASASQDTPTAGKAPTATGVPAPRKASVFEDLPVSEGVLASADARPSQHTPSSTGAPTSTDARSSGETPASGCVPLPENVHALENAPASTDERFSEETPTSEDAPLPADVHATENVPTFMDARPSGETPTSGGPCFPADVHAMGNVPACTDASASGKAPGAGSTPASAGTSASVETLSADSDAEMADRIARLVVRHPNDVSVLLLGDRPGEPVLVDAEGRVQAPAPLGGGLPGRLPVLSGAEALDRLHSALARHRPKKAGRRRRA